MGKTFTIVFSGKTVEGEDFEAVKSKLLSLYDNHKEKIEILFSGNPIVIKRNIDEQTALEYQKLFARYGAALDIVPTEKPNEKPSPSAPRPANSENQSSARKIRCPSCNFEQPPANECVKCGIIFQKFHQQNSAKTRGNAPSAVQRNTNKPPQHLKTGGKTKKSKGWFKKIRIAVLLLILIAVGLNEYLSNKRIASWKEPLTVAVYPINRDNSPEAAEYIDSIGEKEFQSIEFFMQEEAELCELPLVNPIVIQVAPEIKNPPPMPPKQQTALNMIIWTLKMRYWAFRNDTFDAPKDVRIFVLYCSPANYEIGEVSMGLRKGKIGIVNAPADRRRENHNNLVITHEMLHTFGATDKYDYASSMPIYPHGLADPGKKPLYPQEMAEIMAGRIPVSSSEIKWPANLNQVVIGVKTCVEINWLPREQLEKFEAEL